MSRDIVSVILIVYCFIAVWFVGGLTVFHFYLICTNQTTYENFRYRYDKKENLYSKGIIRNLREHFFSKSPPSLIIFRAWVLEDDDTVKGSIAPNFGGGLLSSKERVDIEMGSKLNKDGGMPLPNILQNLDYTGIDDNLKRKGGDEDIAFDPFFFPIAQEMRYSERSSTVGDCTITDKRTEDGSSHKTTSPILQG